MKRETAVKPGILKGFQRWKLKGRTYPGVVKSDDPEHSVQGIIVCNLTMLDIEVLDYFEGFEYYRGTVDIDGTKCFVYIYTNKDNLLSPDWSYDEDFLPYEHEWV